MKLPPLTPALQLSLRAAVAAALAVSVADVLALQFPVYALIGAVIVCDLSPSQTRQLGIRRLLGSLVGATIGAAMSDLLPTTIWSTSLGILVAMFVSHLVLLPGAARLAGYVCGIILLSYREQPWVHAAYRLTETALGIGAAVLVSYVPLLVRMQEPEDAAG